MDAVSNINSFQLPIAPPLSTNRVDRDIAPDPNRVAPAADSRTAGRSDGRNGASDLPAALPASRVAGASPTIAPQRGPATPSDVDTGNPVAGPSPRKSVFDRIMEIDAKKDASAVLKLSEITPAGAEQSMQFLNTLSELRASSAGEAAMRERSFYVPPRPSEPTASTSAEPSRASDPNSAERKATASEVRDNERDGTVV